MDWMNLLTTVGPLVLIALLDYFIAKSKADSNSLIEVLLTSVKKALSK